MPDDFDDILGDEDEEDDDEENDDDKAKHKASMQRISKKFNAFLADIADDMLDPEIVQKIDKQLQKKVKAAGMLPTFTNLKLFAAGFEYGMAATMKLKGEVAPLLVGMKKAIKQREDKQPKIDITKTQLPPEK